MNLKKSRTFFLVLCLASSFLLNAAGIQEVKEKGELRTVKAAALKGPSGFGMIRMFEVPPELGEGYDSEF